MKANIATIKRLTSLTNKNKRLMYIFEDDNWKIIESSEYVKVSRLLGFPFAKMEFKMFIPQEKWAFQGYFKIDTLDHLTSVTTSNLIEEHIKQRVYQLKMERRSQNGKTSCQT